MNQRNVAVDIARGLGIILVVAGHNRGIQQFSEVIRVIYSFHMPLFFFLAGLFLKETDGFRKILVSRLDSLLKPYLFIFFVLGIFKLLLTKTNPVPYFSGILFGAANTIPWLPLWFLPHLVIASIFAWLVLKVFRVDHLHRNNAVMATAAGMLIFGGSTLNTFYQRDHIGLPWSADMLLVTGSYVLFGYAFRDAVFNLRFDVSRFCIALALFLALHAFFNVSIDLNNRSFGNLPIAIAQSALGIYLTLSFSTSAKGWIVKPLTYLGASSLFILIFHDIIQKNVFNVLYAAHLSLISSSVIALGIALAAPLLLLETVKRIPVAPLFMLPRRGKRTGDALPPVRINQSPG